MWHPISQVTKISIVRSARGGKALSWRDLFAIGRRARSAGCLTESGRASNSLTKIGRDFVRAHIIPNGGLVVARPMPAPKRPLWIGRISDKESVRSGSSRSVVENVNPGLHRFRETRRAADAKLLHSSSQWVLLNPESRRCSITSTNDPDARIKSPEYVISFHLVEARQRALASAGARSAPTRRLECAMRTAEKKSRRAR